MDAIIIYDSVFGNTEKIAQAIYDGAASVVNAQIFKVSDIKAEQLAGIKVLIIGSPTRGFRPTETVTAFLKSLPANSLAGVKVAAFDTRLSLSDTKSAFTRFIVKTGGYAAKTIGNSLVKKGGTLVVLPEGFLVIGEEGPLKDGELERASQWAGAFV